MGTWATNYADKKGDSNQRILESDLAELRRRLELAEAVADKAEALMRTAGLIETDKVSVLSFHPHMFNALREAIEVREQEFPTTFAGEADRYS